LTIPYILMAGEVAPFSGTGEEADENLLTHKWEQVEQTFHPTIPKAWAEATGVTSFPKNTLECSACGAKWFSQQGYYPCGEEVRLAENIYLERPPSKPKYSS
jgi:hypothetical protein